MKSKDLKLKIAVLLMILFLALPVSTRAEVTMKLDVDLPLAAEAAVLMEAHNNQVLYDKNAEARMHPASLTKIMTLLLVGEALDQELIHWDDQVKVSLDAYRMNIGSRMFLEHEQIVSVEDLVKGIAIISANDACVAIAEYIHGSEQAFVQNMNKRASELGLKNTSFANSHGLHDPDQYMSAMDVARLAAYFIRTQQKIAGFQAEKEWTFNDIRQFNRNPLLGKYEGVDGIKTGFLNEAGWCLAATARRDGLRLISVVLKSPDAATRKADSEVLLQHGFNRYELIKIAAAGEMMESIKVSRGKEKTAPVVPAGDIDVVIPRGQERFIKEESTVGQKKIKAPLKKGDELGHLKVYYDQNLLLHKKLVAGKDIERQGFLASIGSSIKEFFVSIWQRIFGSGKNS
ncbi:MAG: D-alanyl-D-alanine carboxypeptidase [Firmicutes bacterium]|nr:D-alanyl-D-alanine carboxypeptidase [Bacillota bacterium]